MKKTISFIPGPVTISNEVSESFGKAAYSHRSPEFYELVIQLKDKLSLFTRAQYSTFMMGSGSLANEAISSHLSSLKGGSGLVLSNGEFGERLISQAGRYGLKFQILKKEWGGVFDYDEISKILQNNNIEWIWFVHCETSTGVINDLDKIASLAEATHIKVCVDCISTIGVYKLDLSKVYLASASSNKGLESFAGVAIVLHNQLIKSNPTIPQYLDIGFYHEKNGVPFTFSSNLFTALDKSLEIILKNDKTKQVKELNEDLIRFLDAQNIQIVADETVRSRAITTVKFEKEKQSEELGKFLEDNGILVHYQNGYLKKRNWLQIAFFSRMVTFDDLEKLKNLIVKFHSL